MKIRKLTSNKLGQSGFTLIELLVVIGILAILLAITLIALNPTQHFQGARNAQRQSDVTAILDSIYEYESSHSGNQPPSVTSVSTAVPLGALAAKSATSVTFSTPNVTFTVAAGNTITNGSVTVTGCSVGADNGTFPVSSGTGTTIVVTNASGVAGATGCSIGGWTGIVDVCADVVPTYLAALPMDPGAATGVSCTAPYNTGYQIARANGRFTISAPSAEGGATISVTR